VFGDPLPEPGVSAWIGLVETAGDDADRRCSRAAGSLMNGAVDSQGEARDDAYAYG
jgi:hypothetical protein